VVRALAVGLMMLAASAQPGDAARQPEIPLFSEALARERGPATAPFIATYRSGTKVLGFVGADHLFNLENSTVDSIRRAFDETKPTLLIIEGIPTALGRNFAPILQAVRRRETSDADPFSRSEAVFAASLAVRDGIPFLGGEPSMTEELDGLIARGYTRDEVLFALRLRSLGQARQSGEMPAGDAAAFSAGYQREARAVAQMTGTRAQTEESFISDYRRMTGVDPVADLEMAHRYVPGTKDTLQKMAADNMRFRDEHLLAIILDGLDTDSRVLVVYGSSHWTTLSRALEDRLGKPQIRIPAN
jgi:hypothetical protein